MEVNTPPKLTDITNATLIAGETLKFIVGATDSDAPSNNLKFSLRDQFPLGATIDPVTGEFRWATKASDEQGSYRITVRVDDQSSPNLSDETTFTVDLHKDDCTFGLETGALRIETKRRTNGNSGTVSFSQCNAVLKEGDSFNVTLSQSFTVPNAPSAIQFSIGNPDFDSQDLSLVRDAFEVSLLDEFGNSLVSTLGPGQDSFLNVSEEIGVRSASGIQVNGSTFLSA